MIKKISIILILFFIFITNISASGEKSTKANKKILYVKSWYGGKSDGTKERPYNSIKKAINMGAENATIVLMQGSYQEVEIRLKKGQKIISNKPYEAIMNPSGNSFDIFQLLDGCDGCKIIGLEFNMNAYKAKGRPVLCQNSTNIEIMDNIFKTNGPCLKLCNGTVSNNTINGIFGIEVTAPSSQKKLLIENNEIKINGSLYPGFGLSIGGEQNSCRLIIRGNKISGQQSIGISVTTSSNAVFENNIIKNNSLIGIRIWGNNTYSWGLIDFGGGAGGSKGENKIQGNGQSENGFDLVNESLLKIWAQNNEWDHSSTLEIDKSDIKDDDENSGGEVIFTSLK